MICSNCQHQNHQHANFCSKCGLELVEVLQKNTDYKRNITRISVFFFTLLGYILVISLIPHESDYISSIFHDSIFALIVLLFFFLNFKETILQFKFEKPRLSLLLALIFGAIAYATLVSVFAEFLNQSLFNESQDAYYEVFQNSPAPLLFSVISIGVFPAIFEEIAFRGVVFGELEKIAGATSAIVVSAILFTILHLSLFSILWIFPIGLLFGYLRAKYKTLWYGIIGHFLYNSSIIFIEYFF
ncbi:MAG: hypothetical protein CVU11_00400 [Bacteroidetes bacterium HGW-Bacteroidetes-6]|jgi:membrane protease YdiL (CAAX protease family)|nr:MAG: hypothetical protein CVU11_00400 [Bacteroidetes bacterium HGW-Bacteroidetes-6]